MSTKKTVAAMGLVLLASIVLAQVVIGLKAAKTAKVAWDAPTTNEDGTPLTDLAGFRVAISASDVDLNASGVALATKDVPDPATTQAQILELVTGRPAGTYKLWCLAYDAAGNESQWCDPVLFDYDPTSPGKPLKPRLEK